MNASATKLMKFWIVVVLCFGALSDVLGAEASSNPPEVNRGQGSPPAAVPSPSDLSTLYGSLFYPHADRPSGPARDGPQPFGNYEEDEGNYIYPDQEEEEEGLEEDTARAMMGSRGEEGDEGTKRSMGMLRLGRRASLVAKRPRTMAALRLGRSVSVPEGAAWRKRSMGMLRLGRSEEAAEADEADEEKRSMGLLRLGRRSRLLGADDEKRSMGMLRLGRSQGRR